MINSHSAIGTLFPAASRRGGQVLVLTTLTIGGVLIGASAVAGLLMTYQIRQVSDITNSAKSVFAADTGIEWGLYQFFKPGTLSAPTLSNGATFTTTCAPSGDCTDVNATLITSVGKSADTERAFDLDL